MLTAKENFLETIRPDGKPDRLVNCYEVMELVFLPTLMAEHHSCAPGGMAKDAYGVTWKWAEGQPAAAPWHTEDNLVIDDITLWKEQLVFPEPWDADWSMAEQQRDKTRADGQIDAAFFPTGVFERLHMLLGFEGALVAMMEEPEAFGELIDAIAAHRMRHAEIMVEKLQPEAVFFHDDWGMKTSLFMQPELWRQFMKPHYAELTKYYRDRGILVIHHADSFLEPIVPDMAEIGIACWQGALPQNDIGKLQQQLGGRMAIMGGIDMAIADTATVEESVVRAITREQCERFGPAGGFIPCYTVGGPHGMIHGDKEPIIMDEIDLYNEEVYGHSGRGTRPEFKPFWMGPED
jgi:hypothetical protein